MSAATAAMDSAGEWSTNGKGCGWESECSPTYPVRGICPEGWHLPANSEWNALFTAVGGRSAADMMLKSTSGWFDSGNGTDAYSFAALPAGYRYVDGSFTDEGEYVDFWCSTEEGEAGDFAYSMGLGFVLGIAKLADYSKLKGFSVRCVKD